jgi:hypothetical protein
MAITPQQFGQMLARTAANRGRLPPSDEPVEKESRLAEFVRVECVRRGWVDFHGQSRKPSGRTPGEPDRLIFCEYPRCILMELKARDEKLKPDQIAIHAMLRKLGWNPVVCRSESEVLEVFEKP